jgi:hypothetical protein
MKTSSFSLIAPAAPVAATVTALLLLGLNGNFATAEAAPDKADLEVMVKGTPAAEVKVGHHVAYAITITNNGLTPATGVL